MMYWFGGMGLFGSLLMLLVWVALLLLLIWAVRTYLTDLRTKQGHEEPRQRVEE